MLSEKRRKEAQEMIDCRINNSSTFGDLRF